MYQSSVSSSLLAGRDWKVAIVETTPGIVLPHESFGFVSVIVTERASMYCSSQRRNSPVPQMFGPSATDSFPHLPMLQPTFCDFSVQTRALECVIA